MIDLLIFHLPVRLSPHAFRVTGITALLTQGVPLNDVQSLAEQQSANDQALRPATKESDAEHRVEAFDFAPSAKTTFSTHDALGPNKWNFQIFSKD